ncbi:hypothetical protein J7L68_08095 [bacterium]|nr:hypothetical protein [bacterium]
MKFYYLKILVILAGIFILLSGCDYGISPLNAPVLAGEVHFIGRMPQNVELCFVVIAIDRPPNDELDITYLGNYYGLPDSTLYSLKDTTICENDTNTIDFKISVGKGTYNWLFVAAIGNTDSVGIWNVVGEYKIDGDTIPTPITLGWDDSIYVEITANLNGVHIP